jgi:predicted PurR-regulated permease PerM
VRERGFGVDKSNDQTFKTQDIPRRGVTLPVHKKLIMTEQFNNRIRQIIILFIILALGFLIVEELYVFLPGFLGAVTFYIIGRNMWFDLTERRKWGKSITATLFLTALFVLIGLPLYYVFRLVTPRIHDIFSHSDELLKGVKALSDRITAIAGFEVVTTESITSVRTRMSSFIPTFLNSTANILSNIAVMFFVLYFMFTNGRDMERHINGYLPLSRSSIDVLAAETMTSVRANAIGIPLISLIQGITATIGYAIFGLNDWGMWGFLTGVFAFFPIVGTLVIWVPLVIYLYAQGMNWQGTGLMIYSLIVTGNIDYVARIKLMKKIGDVHPLVTVFGVIVGLNLFGFMGFIFGPLLFSYLIILMRIYTFEFVNHSYKDLHGDR